ncbi:MAG: coproporphyrinogen dehydrogenase HemZ [Ruminococcus flavefaciens]|nr:coproporphyrinogen dehydrogenase HemZ [Ruminococcus flavefaciens]
MNNLFKMPVILIGNSFKYEIESTLKMFFQTEKFNFSDDIQNATGESFVVAGVENNRIYADIRLDGEVFHNEKNIPTDDDKYTEHELCRIIYHILRDKTGINQPWGLMTGIRPVKKVTELIAQGKDFTEISNILTEKYELSPDKLKLAYDTAVNQLPIIEKINRKAVSLYISIPFCPSRCSYCSFVSHSIESAGKLIPDYVKCLCRELEIISRIIKEAGNEIDTIYFGGGTPSAIPAEDIRTIMECVQKNFDLDKIREYSFEAGRPDTITEEKLRIIKELGAERISINPQTLNDDVLKVIGRRHTGEDALRAFELARKVGFENINTDLIAGLPTETANSFRNTLDRIVDISPESITVHTLTLKRSASLFPDGKANITNPASEMVDYSIEKLMSNDYLPYYMYRQKNTVDNLENVGYAKKGFESYYNIYIMDETQTIVGAGSGASTKLVYPDNRITRIHNYKFPYEYIGSFDKLMEKKKEITECLKKINL